MQQKFKINFPDYFTTLLVSVEQTLQETMDIMLKKLDIPRVYGEICGIFKQSFDKLQILQKESKIKHFFEASATYFFRIIVFPTAKDLPDVNKNFRKLIFKQINYYIQRGCYWLTEKQLEISYTLAAFDCAINYGKFSDSKYREGFLCNVLKNLPLPQRVFEQMEDEAIEDEIFSVWRKMTEDGIIDVESKEQLYDCYLNCVQTQLKNFGCFIIEAEFEEAKKPQDKRFNIGIGVEGYHIQACNGSEANLGTFQNTFLDYEKQIIKIVLGTNFYKLKVSLKDPQQLIEFIQYNQFYKDGRHKVQNEETSESVYDDKQASVREEQPMKEKVKKHSTAHSSQRNSEVARKDSTQKRKKHKHSRSSVQDTLQ